MLRHCFRHHRKVPFSPFFFFNCRVFLLSFEITQTTALYLSIYLLFLCSSTQLYHQSNCFRVETKAKKKWKLTPLPPSEREQNTDNNKRCVCVCVFLRGGDMRSKNF
ncbi:hypothetical protein, unlikely [Trypanosoma brucei gambiense DAL972]|uniref:Uncharacterized protein n=1 Tax=Trypanosoma brucei gambiense (strain MHOM/CI/86/DAL972) TaxID=679716 RepID=C9ZSS7_TRYB9|nr:hypothetical protein, unlikely [Trypanosoma brucei gambiense DAL972]CBH12461.1 hypothetical protein, unlikely [Trypanosoma brucei gambiense DAL972]|eukprot:XP_011774742.1 hypothetical protein, unlikely [Trypanosoma brucei gambiense DAL972]